MNVEFVRESLSWKSEDPAELLFFSGDPVLFLNLIFGKFLYKKATLMKKATKKKNNNYIQFNIFYYILYTISTYKPLTNHFFQ